MEYEKIKRVYDWKNDEFRKNDITLTSPAAKSTCWTRREMVVRFIIEE